MAKRRSFKSDEEFLTYVSMGAYGVRQVMADLKRQGHTPLLLERGSDDFKLWKQVRIKGMRVPDVLLVNNGRRIESRAKTGFEISGSHSPTNAERSWDFGLDDGDYMAIPVCEKCGNRPVDWKAGTLVQYVAIGELRKAKQDGLTVMSDPKAASQGSETRIIWPSSVASSPGVVALVSEDRVQYKTDAGRTNTIGLSKQGKKLLPRLTVGQRVQVDQVLAAVVPVVTTVPADPVVDFSKYLADLQSAATSVRFAAAKALAIFNAPAIPPALVDRLNNKEEHIFVRLEAAGSLTKLSAQAGWDFLTAGLKDEFADNRLETVIVLAELRTQQARTMLLNVLADRAELADVRAGAAWALGEHRHASALAALVGAFTDSSEDIRIEAARALAKIAPQAPADMLTAFKNAIDESRPGVAWAIGQAGGVSIDQLLPALTNDDARQWAAYIVGTQDRAKYIDQIEQLKQADPEVYFAVTVLWKILTSWVFDLKDFG